MNACSVGNNEVAKNLIHHGAKVDAQTGLGVSALNFASERGFLETVKLLIKYKANVNLARNDGSTPLIIACQAGFLEIVRVLVTNGANINQGRHDGATALMGASQYGFVDIMEFLIKNKADVNVICDLEEFSPLNFAAQGGHLEAVELLLNRGARLNMSSPIFLAIAGGHVETVRLLLNYGADIDRLYSGETALTISCSNRRLEIIKLLLARGAMVDIGISNSIGGNPFINAIRRGHKDVAELLFQHGPCTANFEDVLQQFGISSNSL